MLGIEGSRDPTRFWDPPDIVKPFLDLHVDLDRRGGLDDFCCSLYWEIPPDRHNACQTGGIALWSEKIECLLESTFFQFRVFDLRIIAHWLPSLFLHEPAIMLEVEAA